MLQTLDQAYKLKGRRINMNTFTTITAHAHAAMLAAMAAPSSSFEDGDYRLADWGVTAAYVRLPRPLGQCGKNREIEILPDARGIITLARVKAALRR
jgi:hypothetical protein